jgi:hypothetical protein
MYCMISKQKTQKRRKCLNCRMSRVSCRRSQSAAATRTTCSSRRRRLTISSQQGEAQHQLLEDDSGEQLRRGGAVLRSRNRILLSSKGKNSKACIVIYLLFVHFSEYRRGMPASTKKCIGKK